MEYKKIVLAVYQVSLNSFFFVQHFVIFADLEVISDSRINVI